MNDVDWHLRRELLALRERFRELMEKALVSSSPGLSSAPSCECPVDVWESDSEIVVEAELPGITRDEIQLRLEGNTLILMGELPGSAAECGRFLHVERCRGQFRRTVELPSPVVGEPQAVFDAGVLEVRLPKTIAGKIRIEVQGGAP